MQMCRPLGVTLWGRAWGPVRLQVSVGNLKDGVQQRPHVAIAWLGSREAGLRALLECW